MQNWIKPPIQPLLWLSGMLLLALTGWSFAQLKLLDEEQAQQVNAVNVNIPDASALDAPSLHRYAQMLNAPLFWESRKAIEPAKPEVPVIVAAPPVDTTLPQGRLIGIIDLGSSLFAIMENAAGGSVHLRNGDQWGAWTVKGIDPDRLILGIGDQRQEISLVGDFSAPKENPQVAQARMVRQQVIQQVQQAFPNTHSEPVPENAGLPYPPDMVQQLPSLSVEEALEARQRLMASRWGGLAGDNK